MENALEVNELYANIGQFEILQGVSLDVPKNQVTVLLGRNGAGKTTTLRTIMGYVRAKSGDIQMGATSLLRLQTWQICRHGVSYLPEEGHVFGHLSVEENLTLSSKGPLDQTRLEEVFGMFPDLHPAFKRRAGSLSGGQKQMLAMACLLVADAPLLIVDEPSKGLSPAFVERLIEVIQELKKTRTILLVEQNFWLASRVGDRFVIIDDGRTALSGAMADFTARADWQQQYMGVHAAGGEW